MTLLDVTLLTSLRESSCLATKTNRPSAAGAAFVLYKRSQPVEDPWAEEYWSEVEAEDEDEEAPAAE